MQRGFASDNYAGIHPRILAAIESVNHGHMTAYGDDEVTERLRHEVRRIFGSHADVFPVFNGTGANVVALQAMTSRWEAVVCTKTAHIHVDEGGAPEKVAGLKLWTVPDVDGKLTVHNLETQCFDKGFVHRAQQAAISISQSTEQGTVYSLSELEELTSFAHDQGLYVHMDGARISNAAAALNVDLQALTSGVDILSYGGTKNGAMMAEALVVLNPELASRVPFIRKTSMQLASKMRFVSAQLLALLEGDLAMSNAQHANAMARLLADSVRGIKDVTITRDVQANAVFAILPAHVTEQLAEEFHFYVWNHLTGEVRWMCAWDTTEDDVRTFAQAIESACKA